jgi:hypothetical protein
MHFNAEEWGDPEHPAFVPRNHFHLLINGCYSPEEVRTDDTRFEMLERIFQRTDAEEIKLGESVANAMAQQTGLPPYVYPHHNARLAGANPYVWARNLLANRTYQCPVIYLEPYVMNNQETYERLIRGYWVGQTLIDGKLVTSPLEDYVQGIVRGLVSYYSSARAKKS